MKYITTNILWRTAILAAPVRPFFHSAAKKRFGIAPARVQSGVLSSFGHSLPLPKQSARVVHHYFFSFGDKALQFVSFARRKFTLGILAHQRIQTFLFPGIKLAKRTIWRLERDEFRKGYSANFANGAGHAQIQALQRRLLPAEPVQTLEVHVDAALPHAAAQFHDSELSFTQNKFQAGIRFNHVSSSTREFTIWSVRYQMEKKRYVQNDD